MPRLPGSSGCGSSRTTSLGMSKASIRAAVSSPRSLPRWTRARARCATSRFSSPTSGAGSSSWPLAPADLPRLADALREAGSAQDVRAVVVQGGGGTFSSGDDLRATAELEPDSWRDTVEGFHDLTRVARGLDVPVICAIDGVCIGGMFEFACSCDLRVATTRARFACPEVGIGLVVSNASTALLPQLCGAGYAAELVLTGRLIDAQEALDHGLVSAIVEPDELENAARALAEEIAARAPLAVQATKRLLVDAQQRAVDEAMARET